MVHTDRGAKLGGVILPSTVEWADVEPGSVLMGSDNRSVLFGGIGPKHEVVIQYPFRISTRPVPLEEADRMIESSDVEIASESEWELAHSRGLLLAGEGATEILADTAQDYWGKACDGRPHRARGQTPNLLRVWLKGIPAQRLQFPVQGSSPSKVRLVKRDFSGWAEEPPRLPSSRNSSRILKEEVVICLFFGVIPSFAWAYFNASDGYIREAWLNLVFGGVFVGTISRLFWRPRQPTWYVGSGMMSKKRVK